MTRLPISRLGLPALIALGICGCASHDMGAAAGRFAYSGHGDPARGGGEAFQDIGYATWSDDEPSYRLYPGDELDIAVPSAPELNKTVTIQPDGRVSLPLVGPVMVADRTTLEAEDALDGAYASQLRRPSEPRRMITTSFRLAVGLKPPAWITACKALMSPGMS